MSEISVMGQTEISVMGQTEISVMGHTEISVMECKTFQKIESVNKAFLL